MVEQPAKTDEQLRETIVECAKAIAEEKSLVDALGISEGYLRRVEQRAHDLYAAERYDSVETLMKGVIAIDSQRFYARLLLGDALTRQGNFKEGLEHLRKAHELAPESEHVRFTLGQAYARGGVIAKAKEALLEIDESSDFHDSASAILERIDQFESQA